MNGADRVTIDGRFGGSGQFITFRNQTTSAPAIGYLNGAQNHFLQHCIIESNNVNTAVNSLLGAVNIGTTNLAIGNSNININNCELRDRSDIAGTPNVLIGVFGTSGYPAQYNKNITIANNLIHDWFLTNSTSQNAISVGTGCTDFTISANSFYQTSARINTTAGATMRAIFVSQSSPLPIYGNYNILNNYIGGTAPLAAGSDMTLSATGTNISVLFQGIFITTGQIPNSIQGNIIRKIDYTTQIPASATSMFLAMSLNNGVHNVGTTAGNIIGDANTNNSIKITMNAGGAVSGFIAGIFYSNVNGYAAISNNTIGGISIAGTHTVGGIPQWIQIQGTPLSSVTQTVSNNLVGSTTLANSIVNNSNMNLISFGLRYLVTTGAPLAATNNTFMNITDNSSSVGAQNYGILVISTVGGSSQLNISNNLVRNMSVNSAPTAPTLVNIGIAIQNFGGVNHSINSNTITGLNSVNTSSLVNGYVVGVQLQGSTLGGNISKNYINDLRNANTGTSPGLHGLYVNSGLSWIVSNNMISVSNATGTNNLDVSGISEFSQKGSGIKLFYNSVFVGGDNATGSINSSAFSRGATSDSEIRNNVFYNMRSGSTSTHCAINIINPSGWNGINVSNNNVFITNDTTKLILHNNTTLALTGYKAITASDLNSVKEITTVITPAASFINAANGDLHRNTTPFFAGVATPISITDDIDGNPRSATTPAAGADEYTICVSINTPTNTTPIGNLIYCSGLTTTLVASAGTSSVNWFNLASGGSAISTGSTIVTSSSLTAGTRTLFAESASNCTVSSTREAIVFTINPSPTITVNSGSICSGQIFTINPSGASIYTISGGSNTVSPISLTNYTVNGTSVDGCLNLNSAISTVTVNANPSLTVSVSGSICAGSTLNVSASGANSYTWNTNSNLATINVSPSVNTTYTVNARSLAGCQSSATANAIVAQNPTVNITGSSGICTGQTASLAASGAITYSWSTGATTSSITSTPGSNTTYTVTGTDSQGCKTTTTQLVTVAASLSISILGSSSICIGQSANLTGSGGVTYTWNTGATSSTIAPSPSVTTSYSVIGASGTCSNTAFTTVSVNPNPTVSVSGNMTFCSGESTTLTASGANSYSWSSGQNTSSIVLTPSVPLNYTVTGTNSFGCSQSTVAPIVVNPLPVIGVTQSAASVCVNSPATFTSTGANTYTWSNSATGTTTSFSPSVTAVYSVNGTNSFGCVGTKTFVINTIALPVLTITPVSATVCSLSQLTLNATGATTYTWNGSLNSQTASFTPNSSTTYTVEGVNSFGCLGSRTIAVTTNSLPIVVSSPASATLCSNTTATFTASGASTYTWNGTIVSATAALTSSASTIYTVRGSNSNGCTSTTTVGLTSNSLPTISVNASAGTVCVNSPATFTANGANTYTWSTASNNTIITITPTSNANYSVSGTNALGCVNTSTFALNTFSLPVVTIAPASATICAGTQLTLNASGASTYTWNGSVNASSFTANPSSSVVYTVTGTSAAGCATTNTVGVTTNTLPIISIAPPSITVCAFGSFSATSTGANTYTWSNNQQGATLSTFAGNSSAVYTVQGTSTQNCTSTGTLAVTTNSLPILVPSTSLTTVCASVPLTLSVTGANTYSWSNGSTLNTATYVPVSQANSYSVVGTDALGCSSSTQIVVLTIPSPSLSVTPSNATVCVQTTLNLIASGAATYSWSTGATSTNVVVTPSANTVYTVYGVSANSLARSGVGTVLVATNPKPIFSFAGVTNTLCANTEATLTASGANTYTWLSSPSNDATIAIAPSSTTVYSVSGTSSLGCIGVGTFSLNVLQLPTLILTPNQPSICAGESTTMSVTGAVNYTWMPGSIISESISVSPTGLLTQYTITGIDQNGCKNEASQVIYTYPCTNITKNALSDTFMEVYPSPSNGIITAKFEFEGKKEIIIYNSIGQAIELKVSENNQEEFDLTKYSKGIYYVSISSTKGNGNFRIIVQ